MVASFGEVCVRFGRFVDEDERSRVANTNTMNELAFEAGLFDEPGDIDFVAVFTTMNGVTFVFGELGFLVGEIDILKEGTGASLFARIGEFVCANLRNDVADALR